MLCLIAILPALAGWVAGQSVQPTITTTINNVAYEAMPTPDALPVDDLLTAIVPTYTSVDGLTEDISSYMTSTAVAAASSDAIASPLSVYVCSGPTRNAVPAIDG